MKKPNLLIEPGTGGFWIFPLSPGFPTMVIEADTMKEAVKLYKRIVSR